MIGSTNLHGSKFYCGNPCTEDWHAEASWLVVGMWCQGQQGGEAEHVTSPPREFGIFLQTFVDALSSDQFFFFYINLE